MDSRARLVSLTIRRYRYLAEPVSFTFGAGAVLLVGRNGSGKTNVLRLIDAVTRLDFRALARDPRGFDVSFTLAWGASRLDVDVEYAPPGGIPDAESHYRARLVTPDASHEVSGKGLESRSPVDPMFRFALVSELAGDGHRVPVELVRGTTFGPEVGRFDEALGAFTAITSGSGSRVVVADASAMAPRGIPATTRGREFCPELLAQRLAHRGAEARTQPLTGADLPFLTAAARACDFVELTCTPQFREEPPFANGSRVTTFGPFAFRARLRDGASVPHDDFSFGQKRIVAFFWHLACVEDEDGVVVADELVNGMHHSAVDALVEAIGDRQAFLASQNPLLFDHMEYATAEDFRQRLVLCDAGAAGGWRWRAPTEGEAARFQEAHDIGYQHVHELLRDQALW